jgi:RNA polymerase sigma-70 factor (ECF subfamily)
MERRPARVAKTLVEGQRCSVRERRAEAALLERGEPQRRAPALRLRFSSRRSPFPAVEALGEGARVPDDWVSILEALVKGDRVALAKVTSLITGFLARYRAYDVRQSWDDLIQDLILGLLRTARSGRLRERRAFVNYVGRATRNALLDHLAERAKPGSADAVGDPEMAETLRARIRAEENRREPGVLIDLQRGLDALPDRHRRVVEAIYLRGHSYAEAAELLGIPLGSLKRVQTQALKRLREQMGRGGEVPVIRFRSGRVLSVGVGPIILEPRNGARGRDDRAGEG